MAGGFDRGNYWLGVNHLSVSKNRGTPKWMVKIMENLIKMDDLGIPLFSETSILPGTMTM